MNHRLAILFFILPIFGCGSINTIQVNQPRLTEFGGKTAKSKDGLAFTVGDVCIYVTEAGSRGIQPRAMTLFGIPIIPVSTTLDEHHPGFFDLEVWIFPSRGTDGWKLDAPQIEVQFSEGSLLSAKVVRVNRFKTRLEPEKTYLIKQEMVEVVSYPEYWGPRPLKDFSESTELWDWSSFTFRFEKPNSSALPIKARLAGLTQRGDNVALPQIGFNFVVETRQAIPGRTADGTSIFDRPDRTCRTLQSAVAN